MADSTYTIEHYESRMEWLAARNRGLGASDAAAVLGLSDWQSPYGLWVAKTEPPESRQMDEIARWGLLLEPAICEELNRVIGDGREVARVKQNTVFRSKERPHIYYSPDAMTDSEEPVQLKTAHFAQAKIWKTKVPLPYMCQMQQEIYVSGAEHGYIAVLKDGYEFKWHKVNRHDKFINRMLAKLDFFWAEYVVKRQPPPLDYSEATTKALWRLYPKDDDTVIMLPDELEDWARERDERMAEIAKSTKRVDEIDNHVRAHIGCASYGRLNDGTGFSWKANGKGTRTLRRVKKVYSPED